MIYEIFTELATLFYDKVLLILTYHNSSSPKYALGNSGPMIIKLELSIRIKCGDKGEKLKHTVFLILTCSVGHLNIAAYIFKFKK